MWIIFRLATFALGILYRFYAISLLGKSFRSHANGLSLYIKNKKNSKTGAESSRVYIKLKSKIFFRLVPESPWFRWYKSIGFANEIQVGDPEFDEKFYIATENYGVINKLRGDVELRKCILRLCELGYCKFTSNGFGQVCLENPEMRTEETDDILREFLRIKNALDLIPTSSFLSEPFVIWVLALEFFLYGLGFYAVSSYGGMIIYTGSTHLNVLEFILKGLMVSIILFFAWIGIIVLALRKSPRGPLLFYEFALPFGLIALVGGFMLFGDLNQALDKSRASLNIGAVESKYTKTTGHRRSRSTTYYLQLKFASNPDSLPERFVVSPWYYSEFNAGDGIEISVRKGFFHSPYIEGYKSTAFPKELRALEKETPKGINKKILRDLAAWAPSANINDKFGGQIQWIEEKYGSGHLRSKEPMVSGKRHGVGQYWHENGNLYTTINWVDGQKHGRIKLYYPSGSIEQSLSYRNGHLHGLCAWYDEYGTITNMALYDHDEVISADLDFLNRLTKEMGGAGLK